MFWDLASHQDKLAMSDMQLFFEDSGGLPQTAVRASGEGVVEYLPILPGGKLADRPAGGPISLFLFQQ